VSHLHCALTADDNDGDRLIVYVPFVCSPECPICEGAGIVCENHPDQVWAEVTLPRHGCACGPGVECPNIAIMRNRR
jgi:hypothetical protein